MVIASSRDARVGVYCPWAIRVVPFAGDSDGPRFTAKPRNTHLEEVTHGRRQRNLRGWDPDLHPHLSGPVFLGQARVGDLRRTLGPHDIEPGAEPPGRGLN